jgi:hypothetical protein
VDRRLTRRGRRQAKRGRVAAEHRPGESPETAIVGGGPASTRGDLPRRGRTVRTSSNRQVRNPSVTTYISSPCPTPPLVDANPNVHRASHPPGGPCRALIAGRVAHRRVLVGQGSPTPSAHTGIRGIVAPVSRRTRRGSRRSSQGLRQPCSLSIRAAWQLPAAPTSPTTLCSEPRQLRYGLSTRSLYRARQTCLELKRLRPRRRDRDPPICSLRSGPPASNADDGQIGSSVAWSSSSRCMVALRFAAYLRAGNESRAREASRSNCGRLLSRVEPPRRQSTIPAGTPVTALISKCSWRTDTHPRRSTRHQRHPLKLSI